MIITAGFIVIELSRRLNIFALSIAVQWIEISDLISSYEFIYEPPSTFLNKIEDFRLLCLSCFDSDLRFKNDKKPIYLKRSLRKKRILGSDHSYLL